MSDAIRKYWYVIWDQLMAHNPHFHDEPYDSQECVLREIRRLQALDKPAVSTSGPAEPSNPTSKNRTYCRCGQFEDVDHACPVTYERLRAALAHAVNTDGGIKPDDYEYIATIVREHNLSGDSSAPETSRDDAYTRRIERKVAAMVTWLEANQPDVFQRGLWDAIEKAGGGSSEETKGRGGVDPSREPTAFQDYVDSLPEKASVNWCDTCGGVKSEDPDKFLLARCRCPSNGKGEL